MAKPKKSAMLKYHIMSAIENAVDSEGKKIAISILSTVLATGYFISSEVDNYDDHLDDVGITEQQQDTYKKISNKIVDFQKTAEQLPLLEEQIELYEDVDERTPDIVKGELVLKNKMVETKKLLNSQLKDLYVTMLTNGNKEDGLAIAETEFDELWQQLELTEPSLKRLQSDFDLIKLANPSPAYLDECRVETTVNPDAPLSVRFNSSEKIANCSDLTAAGRGFLVVGEILGVLLLSAFGATAIDARRKKKFGYRKKRPRPKPPVSH